MEGVRKSLEGAVKELYGQDLTIELTRPEEKFGDYSTNVAMQLSGKLSKNPNEVAEAIVGKLKDSGINATAVGGFINIFLDDKSLAQELDNATQLPKPLEGQEVLAEFGDPNPFKEMHIGHLYSYIVGDSISRLFEAGGADVKRLSYHGDVGLHVAKAIYGLQNLGETDDSSEETIERENFLGKAYAYGAEKYENDAAAKEQIDKINEQIYKHDDPAINKLHEEGCDLSFNYFDKILELLKIKTDKRYLESQTLSAGQKLVEENLGRVFEKSDGAIVYKGEKAGLHTRVFITSQGLPTYETKDLGLTQLKNLDYPDAARSIIITANEQSEYFKVMLAALAEINNELAKKTTHLAHGFLSLSTGKMSSRTGNVFPAMRLLLDVKAAVHEQYPDSPARKEVTFAAVKYAFLKHRLGTDIVVDIKESIGLEGNSGPYLQYAHARARSILAKAGSKESAKVENFEAGERSLARKICEYPEVVAKATEELMPHHICTYLYELAQAFNRFYENNRVIDDPRQNTRLGLVGKYAEVLEHGLGLLNIEAPEKM